MIRALRASAIWEVHHLSKEEFDHGATRNRGRYSRADIMVFMTDAVPADERLIEHLTAALTRGARRESVIMACARQLPDKDLRHGRAILPVPLIIRRTAIKTKRTWEEGIKTFLPPMALCL